MAVGVLAGVFFAGGLTGCGGGSGEAAPSEPATPPSTKPHFDPTPKEAWTAEVPQPSPEAQRDDVEGACAFGEFVVRSLSYDSARGRHDTFDKYGRPECQYCNRFIEGADEERKNGGWTRGQEVSDMVAELAHPTDVADEYYCSWNFVTAPARVWDGKSSEVTQYDSEPLHAQMIVVRDSGQWTIRELVIQSAGES